MKIKGQILHEKIAELKQKNSKEVDIATLEKMRVEAIMSGSEKDHPHLKQYTDETEHEKIIKSSKLPFDAVYENGITGDVGIIVVQSMLLTGFDAPIEQVLYLDNVIKYHNLLQAIARVNRVAKNKNCGFVVDYVGVAEHLREVLSFYEDKDIAEILEVVKDAGKDIDELKYTLLEIKEFLVRLEIDNLDCIDEIVDELADEKPAMIL